MLADIRVLNLSQANHSSCKCTMALLHTSFDCTSQCSLPSGDDASYSTPIANIQVGSPSFSQVSVHSPSNVQQTKLQSRSLSIARKAPKRRRLKLVKRQSCSHTASLQQAQQPSQLPSSPMPPLPVQQSMPPLPVQHGQEVMGPFRRHHKHVGLMEAVKDWKDKYALSCTKFAVCQKSLADTHARVETLTEDKVGLDKHSKALQSQLASTQAALADCEADLAMEIAARDRVRDLYHSTLQELMDLTLKIARFQN